MEDLHIWCTENQLSILVPRPINWYFSVRFEKLEFLIEINTEAIQTLWLDAFELQQSSEGASVCERSTHKVRGTNKCIPCTESCSPTQGLTMNCGYNAAGNQKQAACRTCPPGHYSSLSSKYTKRRTIRICKACKPCGNYHRIEKSSCSLSSDAVCGECKKG